MWSTSSAFPGPSETCPALAGARTCFPAATISRLSFPGCPTSILRLLEQPAVPTRICDSQSAKYFSLLQGIIIRNLHSGIPDTQLIEKHVVTATVVSVTVL